MDKSIKQISLMTFGATALLLSGLVMPAYADEDHGKGHEDKVTICHVPPGNPGNPQTLRVDSSAVNAHLSEHAGDHLGACGAADKNKDSSVTSGSVCVSLAVLTESISKDKSKEDDQAKDEHDKKDAEDQAKAEEDDYAKSEHDTATQYGQSGDVADRDSHESLAKEHEDKAKEHEDKSKEYEDKAKEHEDKSKEYETTEANIESLQGNCKVPVAANDGTVSTEPGVWIPGTPDYVAGKLAEDGGASELINSISKDGGATIDNSAEDASMDSYREIRGQ